MLAEKDGMFVPTTAAKRAQALPEAHRSVAVGGGARMGFFLFLMVNALLFIRPADLFPGLKALHLYELSMLGCLAISLPWLLPQFRLASLRARPITACILCLLLFVAITPLYRGYTGLFTEYAPEFAKMVLYYLVLTAIIRDVKHLRTFVLFLGGCIAIVGLIPVLAHHGYLHLESVQAISDVRTDAQTGKMVHFDRTQGVGIFADPNDLAQILGVGIILCLYATQVTRSWVVRCLWAVPCVVMLYGIYLSQSRGGLMAFGVGMMVLFVTRYGLKKSLILIALALPVITVFSGRQTSLSTEEGSAQSRVQLWADSLEAVKTWPIMGVGAGAMGDFYMSQVAHNTYLHMLGELGLIGGTAFMGAYWVATWGLARLKPSKGLVTDPDLRTMRPFLGAAIATYAMGMMSLSRGYALPTYTLLGLTTVFIGLVKTRPQIPAMRLDRAFIKQIVIVTLAFLVVMHLFVAANVRWSGS